MQLLRGARYSPCTTSRKRCGEFQRKEVAVITCKYGLAVRKKMSGYHFCLLKDGEPILSQGDFTGWADPMEAMRKRVDFSLPKATVTYQLDAGEIAKAKHELKVRGYDRDDKDG
jgi:hypothetical protein